MVMGVRRSTIAEVGLNWHDLESETLTYLQCVKDTVAHLIDW